MHDISDILTGLLAAAFGAILILWVTPAQTVPAIFASVPSAFYANFTCGMLIVSGLALSVSGLMSKAQQKRAGSASHIAIRFGIAFILLVGAMFLAPILGFWQTGILICLITLFLMREFNWRMLATISITAPVFVWAAFELLLGRPLP